MNIEFFINKAKNRYNGLYDYSNFQAKSWKDKSDIKCLKHNYVFQQTADKHLQAKHSCHLCLKEYKQSTAAAVALKRHVNLSKAMANKFLERLTLLKENFETNAFIYEVVDQPTVTTLKELKVNFICKNCAYFYQLTNFAYKRLYTEFCPRCVINLSKVTRTSDYYSVINRCNNHYNFKYIYPKTNLDLYVNMRSVIDIVCPIHGLFKKSFAKHLQGQHCFRCAIDDLVANKKLLGNYSDCFFLRNPDKKFVNAFVYYLKVGPYYKIGITTNLDKRLKAIESKSKLSVSLLDSLQTNLYTAYQIEQLILDTHKSFRVFTNWSTELFNIPVVSPLGDYLKMHSL
jgi:hypothetical protein